MSFKHYIYNKEHVAYQ